jgi:hypothetical protein
MYVCVYVCMYVCIYVYMYVGSYVTPYFIKANSTKIKSISDQTQLNSINYTELYVSTYFKSKHCQPHALAALPPGKERRCPLKAVLAPE